MSVTFSRTDTSLLGRWWWTVDRWSLAALLVLVGVGAALILAASPAVAHRIGLESFHFVTRQFMFMVPALAVVLCISMLSPLQVRRLGALGFAVALLLTAATLVLSPEVKGATRWLYLGPLSLQPSEFLKPTFAVVTAWMFALHRQDPGGAGGPAGRHFPGDAAAILLLALVVGLLLLQPDVGMTIVIAAVWCAQYFVAGMALWLIAAAAIVAIGGFLAAYTLLPHVANRIDRFLDPAGHENYQIEKAMDAFSAGGFFGRGPGEGEVKDVLPDAHTDFVFAVAGEEFGLLLCLVIVAVFGFIVLRGYARLMREENLFVVLAATGLFTQFGLQAAINIGVNLRLLPTKGMTLPFVSYGGSSLLALALAMGMALALTRRRPGLGGVS
ncbi:FtsW/RodA/SpoVE family cell cycle protein [Marinibaculum pumilum]|uniref:Probable peptidoglycan glycosyltransferase FtsW n=1 Tax=Marinibaculum pumilum TaxID=1766165 RepID=A0ABV7L0K3_9PROT